MLCDPPPANEAILPQARQGSYFFNRIGRLLPVAKRSKQPNIAAGDDR
jgi:hypothetical protein